MAWLRRALIVLAVLVALVAGLLAAAGTSAALKWLARQASERIGSLAIAGAQGSLYGPLHIDRLVIDLAARRITVSDLEMDWAPTALLLGRVHVLNLHAGRVEVAATEAGPAPQPPAGGGRAPASLGLPLEYVLDSATVDTLAIGTDRRFDDLVLEASYTGHRHEAHVHHLGTPWGTAQADARLGANAPFPVDATARLEGTMRGNEFQVHSAMQGSLQDLAIAAEVRSSGGTGNLQAKVATFAQHPLRDVHLNAAAIDPSRWNRGLPQADLRADAEVRGDAAGRLTGSVQVRNRAPAPADRGGIPMHALTTSVGGDFGELRLRDLRIDFGPGGLVSGAGRLHDAKLELDLAVDALNARELATSLLPTRLNGPLKIVAGARRQQLSTHLRDHEVQIVLEAAQESGVVDVSRLQLRSGAATLAGNGSLALQEPREFSARLHLADFDPARFGNFPSARINATADADGRLLPQPNAHIAVQIANSSLRRSPLSGNATIAIAGGRLDPSRITLRLGRNHLVASGKLGAPGDTLRFDLDAPRLAALGRPFAGLLRARGTVKGSFDAPQVAATLQATGLALPGDIGAAALNGDVDASVQGGDFAAARARFALRGSELRFGRQALASMRAKGRLEGGLQGRIELNAEAEGIRAGTIEVATASVALAGTREHHTIDASATGSRFTLQARLAGALDETTTWRGRVLSFASGGDYPARLQAPATLVVGAQEQRLEDARFVVGDGSVDLARFAREGGAIETRGEMQQLPTAYANRWLPQLQTTLTLSGDWDVSLADRLAGTLRIRRDGGDVVLQGARGKLALQLERLQIDASLSQQEVRAHVDAASGSIGKLSAALRLPAVLLPGPLASASRAHGRIPKGPFTLDVQANVPRLEALQTLLPSDTTMSGAATLQLQGSGSVEAPQLHGTLQATDLQVRAGKRSQTTERADVVLSAETAPHGSRTQLTAKLTAEAVAKGETLIDLDGSLATEYALAEQRLMLPASAPLDATLAVRVDSLAWLARLLAPATNGGGALRVDARAEGTLGAPRLQASVDGRNLQAVLAKGSLPVRDGRLQAHVEGTLDRTRGRGDVATTLSASATPFGTMTGTLHTEVARRQGHWGLPGTAPLRLQMDASMQSLAWAGPLIGPGALVEGSAALHVRADGTVAEPGLNGSLNGKSLKVYEARSGLDLEQGEVVASLERNVVVLKMLRLKGGDGELLGDGRVQLSGNREGSLNLRANQLRVLNRPDRQLVASGAATVTATHGKITLAGEFKADRAIVEAPEGRAPELGPDVKVVGAPAQQPRTPTPVALDVRLDLGDHFFVKAAGLDAQVSGQVKIVADAGEPPRAIGTLKVEKGTYSAFGQKLTLERAQLRFNGPVDNPQLDIRAVREDAAVKAGVAITGTAQNPRADLFSTPEVPDTEKMAWLVLGHGLDGTNSREFNVLQAATGFLLGKGESASMQARLAQATGLDEVGVTATNDGENGAGAALTLGKRLNDHLFLAYERGLGTATNLIKLTYDITDRWKVQTESGSENAVDLFYTMSFD